LKEAADRGERRITTHIQLDAVAVCELAFGRERCDGFEFGLSSESFADSAHTDVEAPYDFLYTEGWWRSEEMFIDGTQRGWVFKKLEKSANISAISD